MGDFKIISLFLSIVSTGAQVLAQSNSAHLVYATYVSKGLDSVGYSLAVDSAGYAYIGGGTSDGSGCAFVTKLNQMGTAAIWSVCLSTGRVSALALDSMGNVFAAGYSIMSNGAAATSTVYKLGPDGTQTGYVAVVSGAAVSQMVLDQTGNVYLSGSRYTGFVPTPGAFSATDGLGFAAKLNAVGRLTYAAALDLSSANGMAVDSQGEAWIVGTSCSGLSTNQPICGPTVAQLSAIRKLNASGSQLLLDVNFGGGSRPVGGSPYLDSALSVSIDPADGVWVGGSAESANVITTPGSFEPLRPSSHTPPGGGIGYLQHYSARGDLLYGTYIGTYSGSYDSGINAVTTDVLGRPYFALNVPDLRLMYTSHIASLSADGSELTFPTTFGSPVEAMALDGKGGLYVGVSTSGGLYTTPGSYLPLYPGSDAAGYLAKFDLTTSVRSTFSSIVNAASYQAGSYSPGEIVTIFGESLPGTPVVTFDGIPAPILYADSNQINTVIPFSVNGSISVVSVDGVGSFNLGLSPAAPGLFTIGTSGEAAVLNQDGSVNSDANPATTSTIVSAFLTGVGTLTPPLADGQFGPSKPPYSIPILGASATINGIAAPITFVGQAPGLIAGAIQINVVIPTGTLSGNAKLFVYIGSYQTQFGSWIAVI